MMDNELRALGLDDKELRFYLAALERGSSSVTELSIKAGVTRTHGYDLLERLASRGLLKTVAGSGGQRVVAEDPGVLISTWERTKDALDALVPRLRAIARSGPNKTSVRVYQGSSEVSRAIAAAANSTGDPVSLLAASTSDNAAFAVHELLAFVGHMQQRAIALRVIAANIVRPRLERLNITESTASVRFLAEGTRLPVVLIVCGDRSVYVSSNEEQFALAIDSAEMASTNQMLFDSLWATAR